MGKPLKAEEEWARKVIGKHLGREVWQHDDGSKDGMYDLRVGPAASPEIAIECVKDAVTASMLVWKKGQDNGPIQVRTAGDWMVEISNAAQLRDLGKHLESLLPRFHAAGISEVFADGGPGSMEPELEEMKRLGVVGATCIERNGSGKVHLSMGLPGGIVDTSGADLAVWVNKFLTDDEHKDVLRKLRLSGAPVRHACVIITLNGRITGPLVHHFTAPDVLPTVCPELPSPVTGVWLLLASGDRGLYCDNAGWQAVDQAV